MLGRVAHYMEKKTNLMLQTGWVIDKLKRPKCERNYKINGRHCPFLDKEGLLKLQKFIKVKK